MRQQVQLARGDQRTAGVVEHPTRLAPGASFVIEGDDGGRWTVLEVGEPPSIYVTHPLAMVEPYLLFV